MKCTEYFDVPEGAGWIIWDGWDVWDRTGFENNTPFGHAVLGFILDSFLLFYFSFYGISRLRRCLPTSIRYWYEYIQDIRVKAGLVEIAGA